jgi:iron(III) transport system permease protein
MAIVDRTATPSLDARRRVARRRWDPLLIGGALIVAIVVVAILALLLTIIVLSFSRQNGAIVFDLTNYVQIFTAPQTLQVLVNSVAFAATSLVVAFGFGLPIAWLIECSDLGGKTTVITLMLITLLIPGFTAAAGWLFLLHPRIGLLNLLLMHLTGATSAPLNVLTVFGMGWVEGLSRVPLAFLMTSAAFRAMDRSLEEAALTAGAPTRAVLWRIVLPLMRPALAAATSR